MLEARVAIVTAASTGMGAATARGLAERGYKVALLARCGAVRTLAAALGDLAVGGSVTDADDRGRPVDTTLAEYGRIDAVVNNTGHPPRSDLLAIPDGD